MNLDHKKYNVPGILLGVSERGGEIKYSTFGLSNIRSKAEIQQNGLFRIGYVARLFTAVLLMRLVDEGALDIDMPLDSLARLNQQDGGLFRLMVSQYDFLKPVTVRELLNNTTGLPAFDKTIAYNEIFMKKPRKKWQVENYLDAISGVGVRYVRGYEMGTRGYFSDSTTNFVVAGLVFEAICGIELSEAMRDLFQELNLTHTHYLPDGVMPEKLIPKMIHGYLPVSHPYALAFSRQRELTYNKSKELRVYDVTDSYNINGMGNAAIVSTAEDLIHTLQLVINAKVVVANYKKMFKPVPITKYLGGLKDSYCMGFYNSISKKHGEVIWAAGNSLGYCTLLAHVIDKDTTFLFLTNVSRQYCNLHSDGLVADVLQQI